MAFKIVKISFEEYDCAEFILKKKIPVYVDMNFTSLLITNH